MAGMTEKDFSIDGNFAASISSCAFDLGEPHIEKKMIGKGIEPATHHRLGRFEIRTLSIDRRERQDSAKLVGFGFRQLASEILCFDEVVLFQRDLVEDIGRICIERTSFIISKDAVETGEVPAKSIEATQEKSNANGIRI